ncbi:MULTISPECIES: SDR family oxidoreductase [Halomonas]|uniref:SDR family oxidoreductase n=1 Tax=Halomonas TaxID=2745 RepID=UPI001A8C4CA0|nr:MULTISPECIES: SDR family oxidoreductase [Halomonas]MED5295329.1 SDR family oxidoreductase [Pseudomonadota bacterium]MBN8411526.1 SDR family oxidoreductase [Halomonas litopenaei]MBY5923961.1 SDR family oxidoreductase [Halomonas sp. DP4Y7-2]MBY5928112.1 SDR family oxidoreductase [Halomonas sp. DP8Y7-3]MBY5982843.1 SDR family oxidoreductase [Halomonas sp. DP5Y7-2]
MDIKNVSTDGIQDKVVIITGASSGLGEATAKRLAKGGARLVLGARRDDRLKRLCEEIKAEGGQAVYRVTDVTDREQVEALAQLARDEFGRIDVLVNNAGLMPLSPLDKLKVDEWDQMVDVNIKGVLYGIAAVLPTMREQHEGHVINLSSVAGHVVFPAAAVYCATKFAVKALTEGLRQESGGEIRATNISPGAIDTELTQSISDDDTAKGVNELYTLAIDADAVARAIAFAVEQPADVDVNELVLRPTRQEL